MRTSAQQVELITYGGYDAAAILYGSRYGEGRGEWRINLAKEGIGYGTLRADNLEAIYLAFADFIDEAMAYQEAGAVAAFASDPDYDYEEERW